MRKTDYSKIVEKYDKNKYRQEIKPDKDLEGFIFNAPGLIPPTSVGTASSVDQVVAVC